MTKRLQGRKGVARRARWLSMHPLCKHCMEQEPPRVRVGTQVDHVVPLFKGGADDDTNLQTLCDPCHAIKTRADMGHIGRAGCDTDGWPSDPLHPWNVQRPE